MANQYTSLTILGLALANMAEADAIVFAFLGILPRLAELRRTTPRRPTQASQIRLESDSPLVAEFLKMPGVSPNPSSLLYRLMDSEPVTSWGAEASISGETWHREIPREIHRFSHITSVEEYVATSVDLIYRPPAQLPMAAPSPFDLPAALDYLDTVWRVATGGGHLFQLHSAQRVAQLAFPAQTQNEFESRLSGLGEILRAFQLPSDAPKVTRERDKPFKPLAAYLRGKLPNSSGRIDRAIATLQAVLDVRDANQHSAAGSKGAVAFVELGVGYPPTSWREAWATVSGRTIEALDAIREELATLTP